MTRLALAGQAEALAFTSVLTRELARQLAARIDASTDGPVDSADAAHSPLSSRFSEGVDGSRGMASVRISPLAVPQLYRRYVLESQGQDVLADIKLQMTLLLSTRVGDSMRLGLCGDGHGAAVAGHTWWLVQLEGNALVFSFSLKGGRPQSTKLCQGVDRMPHRGPTADVGRSEALAKRVELLPELLMRLVGVLYDGRQILALKLAPNVGQSEDRVAVSAPHLRCVIAKLLPSVV